VVRIVADLDLRVNFGELKMGIFLETLVRVPLHKFGKGKGSFDVLINTGGMYGVIRMLLYGVKKPIDFLFFGRWLVGTVVFHLSADLFEKIDVLNHVCAIDVP
jgi:hypothetical protein